MVLASPVLLADHHELTGFRSGVAALDEWLVRRARANQVSGASRVYAAAFYITTILELLGTTLGNWTWAPTDPTGWIAIGNPPSGIAAAYCIVDWVALHAARYAGRATIGLRGHPKTAT